MRFIYQFSYTRTRNDSFEFNLYDNSEYRGLTIEQIQEKNKTYSIICFLPKDIYANSFFTSDDIPF